MRLPHRYCTSPASLLAIVSLASLLLVFALLQLRTVTTTNSISRNDQIGDGEKSNPLEKFIMQQEKAKNVKNGNNVIQKAVIFPQSGNNVKFNQPWKLKDVEVRDSIRRGRRYISSDFDYSRGLGNLMFQWAGIVGLAVKYNATILLPVGCLLRRAFELNDVEGVVETVYITDRLHKEMLLNLHTHSAVSCCSYSTDLRLFTNPSIWIEIVNGYFQNVRWLPIGLHQLVRRFQFRFHAGILELADKFFRKLEEEHPKDTLFVGVHARHGLDIVSHQWNRNYGHVAAPISYYKHAMETTVVRNTPRPVVFVICTDASYWAKQSFDSIRTDGVVFCPTDAEREVHMAILARTHEIIISTGTFGWWAAWLGDQSKVTYYGDWPRNNTRLYVQVQKDEYFPLTWTAMT